MLEVYLWGQDSARLSIPQLRWLYCSISAGFCYSVRGTWQWSQKTHHFQWDYFRSKGLFKMHKGSRTWQMETDTEM